jgi:hypothetical protein
MHFYTVGKVFREAVIPLITLPGLVHLWIALPLLVLVGAERSDQGGIHDRTLAHRHAPRIEVGFHGLKDLLTQPLLFQQGKKVRIVVSSAIRSLISSMPAKRRMVGTSIRGSSIAGSQSEYHCSNRWIRSIAASGYRGRPPLLLVLG